MSPATRNPGVPSKAGAPRPDGFLLRPAPTAEHLCTPPMREVRIYAPRGPAVGERCTCRADTGEVDVECPADGTPTPRAYHPEDVPDGEPGTLWRCRCGQPWQLRVRQVERDRGVYHGVRVWDRTSERQVRRALRRARRRGWWRRG